MRTRHNLGFAAVDCFARVNDLNIREIKYDGLFGTGEIYGMKVAVLKPATFMNRSGISVEKAISDLRITPEKLIVIHDDLDIPEGEVRVKIGGGAGGHKGIGSIIDSLEDDGFVRVKVGIGRPPLDTESTDFVLDQLSQDHWERCFSKAVDKASAAVELIIEKGVERAMTEVNRD